MPNVLLKEAVRADEGLLSLTVELDFLIRMNLAEPLICIEFLGLICIDQIEEAEVLPHLLNGHVVEGLIVEWAFDAPITNQRLSTLLAHGVAALEA